MGRNDCDIVRPGYTTFLKGARGFIDVESVFADDWANHTRDFRVAQDLFELVVMHKESWSAAVIDMTARGQRQRGQVKLPLAGPLLRRQSHAELSK